MPTKPTTHGGKRKGAGRKPAAGGKRQVRISVTLTEEQKEWLVSRKGGASFAVRALVQWAMDGANVEQELTNVG